LVILSYMTFCSSIKQQQLWRLSGTFYNLWIYGKVNYL
jgi:hypothetical protein